MELPCRCEVVEVDLPPGGANETPSGGANETPLGGANETPFLELPWGGANRTPLVLFSASPVIECTSESVASSGDVLAPGGLWTGLAPGTGDLAGGGPRLGGGRLGAARLGAARPGGGGMYYLLPVDKDTAQ